MQVAATIDETREAIAAARAGGATIGFVPTMGYLHEGHLSLVDRCREATDYTVVSIYVNPLQFGPDEDFEEYPRDLEHDLALAGERGVDLVFTPDDAQLYPEELTVTVTPGRLADRLCGRNRPGHFEGVLTVVTKLFGIVQPDLAVFGQKDFQQSVLIRRMVADLNLPVRIDVGPTVREPDGVAMSSRNAYLSDDERASARGISRGLARALEAYRSGQRDAGALVRAVRESMTESGVVEIEYVDAVSADALEPTDRADERTVLAVAAHVGDTRLIDNVRLERPDPGLERLLHKSGRSE